MMSESGIEKMLAAQAAEKQRPDGSLYRSISFRSEQRIVEASGYSHAAVQLTALENDIIPERYARNQKSLNNAEQIQLLTSEVLIVGLGGLGGCVTELLARVGVGSLRLVDGDVFEDSNLNRQLLSTVDDLGKRKADVARERVAAINPAVRVQSFSVYLEQENCEQLIGTADCAVDCLDSIPDRFVLEAGCRLKNIPMISAAIGGETGQATIIYPEEPGLRLIYGEKKSVPAKGVEGSLGTLPYAAVTMASIECAVVVSCLTGKESPLRNSLLFLDLSDFGLERLRFS